MIGNFWVLPRASLSSAAEAQVSFVKILRILPEIHSNFVQYTPQSRALVFTDLFPSARERDSNSCALELVVIPLALFVLAFEERNLGVTIIKDELRIGPVQEPPDVLYEFPLE